MGFALASCLSLNFGVYYVLCLINGLDGIFALSKLNWEIWSFLIILCPITEIISRRKVSCTVWFSLRVL